MAEISKSPGPKAAEISISPGWVRKTNLISYPITALQTSLLEFVTLQFMASVFSLFQSYEVAMTGL